MIRSTLMRHIRETLFYPETGLIYDYVTSREHGRRFAHLPCAAEVAADLPNPCGWGTGMEDCALNAGTVLDTLWRVAPDPDFAERLVEGIARCITLHGRPGFVARGFSVRAPERCYSNSSRDQLTLAVYGLWRILHSYQGISPEFRGRVADMLRCIAEDCRTHITESNHFNLLRLDGCEALVSRLWECEDHEALRLPMVYAAAFEATGDRGWLAEAERFLEPGLVQTETMKNRSSWWDLPTVQMQLSLLLLRECGSFSAFSERFDAVIERVADFALICFDSALQEASMFSGDWGVPNENWRNLPLRLHSDSLSDNGFCAAWQGRFYATPIFPERYNTPNTLLRRLGCWLAIASAGGRSLPEPLRRRLQILLNGIDFSRSCGDGPVKLLHGLAMLDSLEHQT